MDELSNAFTQITDLINEKSSYFLNQYQQQTEEISKLKKELSEKNFEDNNFNKVSMVRTQAKEITELKNHLEILEKRNNSLKEKNQELQKEIEELKTKPEKKVRKPRKNTKPKSNKNIQKNKQKNKPQLESKYESEPQPVPGSKDESEPESEPENNIKLIIKKDNNSKKSNKSKESKKKTKSPKSPKSNKAKNEDLIDEIPDIDDMDVFEFKEVEYYYSTKSYYIYEIANDDGDIGERLGIYKLNGELLLEEGEADGLEVLELEEGGVALLDFF